MYGTYSFRSIQANYVGLNPGASGPPWNSSRPARSRGISRLSIIDVTAGVLALLVGMFTAWLALQQYREPRPEPRTEIVIDNRSGGSQQDKAAAPTASASDRRPQAPSAPRVEPPPASDEKVGDLVDIVEDDGGAVMTGTGLLKFKKHVDDPSINELRKAIGPGVLDNSLLRFADRDANPFRAEF